MADTFGRSVAWVMDQLVKHVIVPVTGIIPVLVRTGILWAVFAALWVGFAAAAILDPAALDAVQRAIADLPLPLGAIAWLLFLPLVAGLWVWTMDWPLVVRIVLLAGIAGWNLFTFLPRRDPATPAIASQEPC